MVCRVSACRGPNSLPVVVIARCDDVPRNGRYVERSVPYGLTSDAASSTEVCENPQNVGFGDIERVVLGGGIRRDHGMARFVELEMGRRLTD